MKGRKPLPSKLHALHGNPSKLKLAERNEPDPKPSMSTCPGHLKGAAVKEWKRITPELYILGLLSQIDRAALAAYCSAYGHWVKAEKGIARLERSDREVAKLQKKNPGQRFSWANGMVRMTSNGNCIMEPLISVSNKAVEQMHKFLTEFGMTPASRARLSTGGGRHEESDPLDKVLNTTKRLN